MIRKTTISVVAVLAAVTATASACTSSGSADTSPTTHASTGNFEHTTCRQWLQFPVATKYRDSREFMRILHAKHQTSAFGYEFAGDITKDCRAAPSIKLAQVVGALATLDKRDFDGAD